MTPLALLRLSLMGRVDEAAEVERQRHLSPGAAMALVYQEKFAQAQAVMGLGADAAGRLTAAQMASQFPTLTASVGIEAPTLYECASIVLRRYAEFAQRTLAIERTRLTAKRAISAASTAAAAMAAFAAVTWTT